MIAGLRERSPLAHFSLAIRDKHLSRPAMEAAEYRVAFRAAEVAVVCHQNCTVAYKADLRSVFEQGVGLLSHREP